MCLIVAVGVAAPFNEVFEAFRHSFGVSVATNPALTQVFPTPMAAYWVTRGGCSCDLSRHEHKEDPDHMRRRLQKKGWSANKINRAVAQSTGPGPAKPESPNAEGFRRGVLRLAAEREVLIFGHWFHGDQDTESIDAIPRVTEADVKAFTVGPLPSLEEALIRVPAMWSVSTT